MGNNNEVEKPETRKHTYMLAFTGKDGEPLRNTVVYDPTQRNLVKTDDEGMCKLEVEVEYKRIGTLDLREVLKDS